jgi:hypothetical protein
MFFFAYLYIHVEITLDLENFWTHALFMRTCRSYIRSEKQNYVLASPLQHGNGALHMDALLNAQCFSAFFMSSYIKG